MRTLCLADYRYFLAQHCFLKVFWGLLEGPNLNVLGEIYLLTKQELLIVYKDAYTWFQLKQNNFYETKLTAN